MKMNHTELSNLLSEIRLTREYLAKLPLHQWQEQQTIWQAVEPLDRVKTLLDRIQEKLSPEADGIETSPEAAAFLMQELICEQIYRNRNQLVKDGKIELDHINKTLGTRSIKPAEVLPYARRVYLRLDQKYVKELASEILDIIIGERKK